MLPALWFWLLSGMIVGYVVLDGFDLGMGAVHLFAARTDEDRRRVLRSIGPVWDGNEVWLIAAGATLYFAFPKVYAVSFTGFYLPLMVLLWLLVLRALGVDLRNHARSALWRDLLDKVFGAASLVIALFLGVALGNVVRGVPLGKEGFFFNAFWTDFRTAGQTGILDWYTLIVGLAAVAALTLHGSLWAIYKTDGDLAARARTMARRAWWAVVLFTVGVTAATFAIQGHIRSRLFHHPGGLAFPALALAGLFAARRNLARNRELSAFLSSCAYLAGMLGACVFGLYPFLLPSNAAPESGLTVWNSAAPGSGLRIGLYWWIPGMLLALGYFFFAYRRFAGKVTLEDEGY